METMKKVRLGNCAVCGESMDAAKLYVVRDKKMCDLCVRVEIAKWNNYAREFWEEMRKP